MKPVVIIAIVAVAMIGVMVPSGFAQQQDIESNSNQLVEEKIPLWIKNLAKLWSEDEISHNEFLNSVKYLTESKIIKISPNSIFEIGLENPQINEIDLNKDIQWHSTASEALKSPNHEYLNLSLIEGKTDNYTSKISVEVTAINPNAETQIITDITRNGKYTVNLKNLDFTISGMYVIETKVDGKLVNTQYSLLDKNENNLENVSLDESKDKIPHWIKNSATWWAEDKISEKDFLQGIKFLVKRDIIPLKQNSLNNLAGEIWFEKIKQNNSKLSPLSNLELNIDSTSDIIDISKYKDNQECRTELKKINKLTIQTMKECDKIISNSHVKIPKMNVDKILENREDPKRWASPGDIPNYASPKECMIQSRADDGVISVSEKSLCDQVNRTWAIDTQIYDNYGNLIGTQALNNCNDLGCRTFTMGEAIQYASNLADAYARISSSEVDKYANQWASGQISYGEYERKAMASMEYYGNQYVYEMESIYDMIIID